jgi:hypothetical protein
MRKPGRGICMQSTSEALELGKYIFCMEKALNAISKISIVSSFLAQKRPDFM